MRGDPEAMATSLRTLRSALAGDIEVLPPRVAGPLAVFPLAGPTAALEYVSFAQGRERGATIHEVAGGASVRDLVVENPSPVPVLLFSGEEVLGAQQNRTFDVSVLVPGMAKLTVPVSCVEAGRWDGTRHGEAFAPAPQTAYPALRRLKEGHVAAAAARGEALRAEQGAVWEEVGRRAADAGAASPTGAMHDVFEHERRRLGDLRDGAGDPVTGQTGALVALGGRIEVLDLVGRADVFAALWPALLEGYCLDALRAAPAPAPPLEQARAFVAGVLAQAVSARPSIGLGDDVRFAAPAAAGSGLIAAEEVVQLTAFAPNGERHAGAPAAAAIRRPRMRRRRGA